ncbi:growth/differentiation factor 8-like [Harmonia axyridis]|uniref:growth/differentiation factor 8-like n=1 Tax=Harmonia axyridis TaxID=115357 RepID=UPI001E275182|nr:growth/differentiation factor 8-like [Harmonia axyridis]
MEPYSLSSLTSSHKLTLGETIKYTLIILLLTVPYILSDNSHSASRTNPKSSFNPYERTSPPSCGSCKNLEDVKARSIEMIKEQILRKIGMKKAPNITGRVLPQIPLHELAMIDQGLAEMQSDQPEFKPGISVTEEEDDDHARTEKMFIFSQKHPRLRHSRKDHEILYFPLLDSTTKYNVANSSLYIYIEGHDRHPLPEINVEIFKVLKLLNHPETSKLQKVVSTTITQPFGKGSWIPFDLTETVSEWFKNTRENHGFVVRAELDGKQIAITDPNGPDKGKIPYLEVTPQQPKSRTRRSSGLNCDERSQQNLCCRYPLTVKFEKIGFDFILAPKSYEAFYCHGECPYLTLQKNAHTHIATMASPNSVQPCCTPRKMRNITMIYFDLHLNVVVSNLPGMVVDRCGCS